MAKYSTGPASQHVLTAYHKGVGHVASVALTPAPRDNRNSHMAGRELYAALWRRVSYLLRGSGWFDAPDSGWRVC